MSILRHPMISAGLLALTGCASVDGFDRATLLDITETLSADDMEGRVPGSAGSAAARKVIAVRMAELGLEPVWETYETPFLYGAIEGAGQGPDKTGVNMSGRIKGTGASDLTLVVSAHYDHVGAIKGEIYNGADDNASGVAGMLAIAEAFSRQRPQHDTIFVAFDVEESHGYAGARDFVSRAAKASWSPAFNLNLDMISRGDNGRLWASGTGHWPDLVPVIEAVAEEAPVELRLGYDSGDGRDDWTELSDHGIFFRAGIPHLYLGVEDHPDYHQPSDDFDKIDTDWFERSAETALRVARAIDANLQDIEAMRAD